jgi:hypothetical protein
LKSEKTSEKAKKTEFCVLGRAKNEQSEFFSGLLEGKGLVNGLARIFALPDTSLAHANGLELQRLCERLGEN